MTVMAAAAAAAAAAVERRDGRTDVRYDNADAGHKNGTGRGEEGRGLAETFAHLHCWKERKCFC